MENQHCGLPDLSHEALSKASSLLGNITEQLAQTFHFPPSPFFGEHPETILTPRQWSVAFLAALNLPHKLIARILGLSIRTVSNVLQSVYIRLDVGDSLGLLCLVWFSGWLRFLPEHVTARVINSSEGF